MACYDDIKTMLAWGTALMLIIGVAAPAWSQSYAERTQNILFSPPANTAIAKNTEDQLFSKLNHLRSKKGVPILRPLAGLRDAARAHSLRMLKDGFFAHKDPDGGNVGERVAALDRRTLFSGVGENIAKISPTGRDQADRVHDGWVDSPGHYKNMILGRYSHIGIGCAVLKRELVCTQAFGEVTGNLITALPIKPGKSGTRDVTAGVHGLDYGGWVLLDRKGTERAKGYGSHLKWPSGLHGEFALRILGKKQEGNRITLYPFFGPSVVLQ